jgi:hypothetical protein
MSPYKADGEQEIQALFDREGDALMRAGFSKPDLTVSPEDLTTQITAGTIPVNEWEARGDALIYTKANSSAVEGWREQARSRAVGGTDIFRSID